MKKLFFWSILFFIVGSLVTIGGDMSRQKLLYETGNVPQYSGKDLTTISFPIGGLGTGNINIGGRGEIRELEIFNRPNKGVHPDMTFFSVWAKGKGQDPVAMILERKLLPPYVGWMGFPRNQLAGVARFDEVVFCGEYPFANIRFLDEQIPVSIELEAFNPYIPLDPERSGIPAALFNWKVRNDKSSQVDVSIAFSMLNPIKTQDENNRNSYGNNLNQYIDEGRFRGIEMTSNRASPKDLEYGSLAIVTSESDVDIQTRWYRGGWWDNAHIFWDDFSDDGRIQIVNDSQESEAGRSDVATVLVHFKLGPGEEKTVPFYLTWYFPNRENYWNREKEVKGKKFQNFYGAGFKGARDVARYIMDNIDELDHDTRAFSTLLSQSTYPSYVIDSLSSQMSSLKTNLVMRVEDGKLFGFEGLTDNSGSCPMNCTHVWNYEQTLAYLFPSLERTCRETDFLHNTFDNGYQVFRTLIPLGDYWWSFKPCADGQMGNIVRVYREWKISGDTEWLKKMWPKVKAALEFAWIGVGNVPEKFKWQKERLLQPWDPDKDGVMEGEQHNTYDIEYYGPNTMTGSLYLAALKACSEMAAAVGDKNKVEEYIKLYRSGSSQYDSQLWNGEYYVQKINVMDGLVVPGHLRSPEKEDDMPKYQYGDGCLSDQLLGQYLAHVAGLGYVLDKTHVDKAMDSIYRYNFKNDLSSFSNVQRVYALNEEAGLLLCSWPKGNRPALPFVYSDEVWTGIEYQVAASLIYSGHIDQGLAIVKAVRDRHRGFNRNPWDEFECGHHYARAMASWAVMLALSGFQYDGVDHYLAFSPRIFQEDFNTFWSTGSGWGSFSIKGKEVRLKIAYGKLKLGSLGLGKELGFRSIKQCRINEKSCLVKYRKGPFFNKVEFREIVSLHRGDELILIF